MLAQPKIDSTADRILDVAEALFAERGYEGTSLRDVAAGVGIQNPSIYNHFASKAALYDAVLERAIAPLLGELWDRPDSRQASLDHLAVHPNLCRLILKETLSGGQTRPAVRDWMRAVVARTGDWLAEQPDAPRWSQVELTLVVLAICHVIAGFYATGDLYAELSDEPPDRDAALEAQGEIVRRVVAALFAAEPKAP